MIEVHASDRAVEINIASLHNLLNLNLKVFIQRDCFTNIKCNQQYFTFRVEYHLLVSENKKLSKIFVRD
jgi:hypothetical protein